MYFISVIKIIYSMKTSLHLGAKGHTRSLDPPLWPDPVCRPLLNAEAQGPQLGAPQGRLKPGADPTLNWGTETTATAGPGFAWRPHHWAPGAPQDRGRRASQQRGKRVQAVGSPGCPRLHPPQDRDQRAGQQRGKRVQAVGHPSARAGAPRPRREGAECRGATETRRGQLSPQVQPVRLWPGLWDS